MGFADNASLVRRGYAAFSTGDMATLSELFADDAVWHVRVSEVWEFTTIRPVMSGSGHSPGVG